MTSLLPQFQLEENKKFDEEFRHLFLILSIHHMNKIKSAIDSRDSRLMDKIVEMVEEMKGKVHAEYHGMDCKRKIRPCGLISHSDLADRCEVKKYDELTLSLIQSKLKQI